MIYRLSRSVTYNDTYQSSSKGATIILSKKFTSWTFNCLQKPRMTGQVQLSLHFCYLFNNLHSFCMNEKLITICVALNHFPHSIMKTYQSENLVGPRACFVEKSLPYLPLSCNSKRCPSNYYNSIWKKVLGHKLWLPSQIARSSLKWSQSRRVSSVSFSTTVPLC